jgi:Ser/Thr protein kinase RdoA (MazF antagonist)
MKDEIVSIAQRELGEPPVRVEQVEEGLLHETYELSCDGGEYILQFSSNREKDQEDALRHGLNCYIMLQNSEIPVPGIVTETVRKSNDRRYTLVEKLPGESGKLDISPKRVRNAGRYLAKIHNVRSFDSSGWIRFEDRDLFVHEFQEGSLKQWIMRTIVENVGTLQEGRVETAGNEVERVFGHVGEDLPDNFDPVLCHNDFTPDNLLFQDCEVLAILDFDRAYSSHNQRDVVKAANCFWMHDPCVDWNIRAKFYEGYGEVNELDDSFEQNEPLYRVETLAGTVAGLLTMDELSEYEKEFYSERILETIERIEEI